MYKMSSSPQQQTNEWPAEAEILGNLFEYYIFYFILLFISSSPCCKDQFAVSYFSWIFLLRINFCYF